jgi:EAL domain-containing protein (putative c-di-GMP-specific phosphodiesterase class I)
MYEAKRGGRNRISIFNQELSARRDAELELEADLVVALERHEFELHYQPLVHLQTGDVIGTEAFVRWNHPRYGLLTPDRFLPTVHALRHHSALGEWILHEACRQAVLWQPADPGRALTMSVNVSPPEVLAPGFVDRVQQAVTAAGLQPGLLVLEISERLAVSDAPAIRERIDRLRQLGVRIAIDDFGTGHLSLTDLRDLPIDAVKIDNSLVEPLGQDTRANSLVRSMVAIAGALDFDIVVEGVETDTQIELLVNLGCQVAQGYRFARPAPAHITGKLLSVSIDAAAGTAIRPSTATQYDPPPRVTTTTS